MCNINEKIILFETLKYITVFIESNAVFIIIFYYYNII